MPIDLSLLPYAVLPPDNVPPLSISGSRLSVFYKENRWGGVWAPYGLYLIVMSDGNVWNGSTFEVRDDSCWAQYVRPSSRVGSSELWTCDFDDLPKGAFDYAFFLYVQRSPEPSITPGTTLDVAVAGCLSKGWPHDERELQLLQT